MVLHKSNSSLTAHHVGHISPEFYALLVSLRMCVVHKVLNITLQELTIITEKGYQIHIKSPRAMFHFLFWCLIDPSFVITGRSDPDQYQINAIESGNNIKVEPVGWQKIGTKWLLVFRGL